MFFCIALLPLLFVCFESNENDGKNQGLTLECSSGSGTVEPEVIDVYDKVKEKKESLPSLQEIYVEEIQKKEDRRDPQKEKESVVQEETKRELFNEKKYILPENNSKVSEEKKDQKQTHSEDDKQNQEPSSDTKKNIYVPGFGYVEDHGGIAVGRRVGKKGDKLTGHLVGSMD